MSVGNANEHLPFDVLGYIFSYYASEENIKYPLETLLLVCKSWSHAALGHRRLWSDLRIHLGHDPASTIWTARLPLRLARCGPDVPLDIDLRYRVSGEHSDLNLDGTFLFRRCSCHIAATTCAKISLQALTGSNGEICARWRSFTLYLGRRQYYEEVRIALSHATPILENLELGNVRFEEEAADLRLFPQVHSLKRLSLFECELPSLPSCDNLLDVSLYWEEPFGKRLDLSSLCSAQKLQSLSLRTCFCPRIRLPGQLPDLRVLTLRGYINIDQTDIFTCQMPQISHLSFEYEGYDVLGQMLHCEGFPVEKLTRLSLRWGPDFVQSNEDISTLMNALHAFLTRTRDLKHLDASDEFMFLVIKVLWNSRNDLAKSNLVRLDDSARLVLKDLCLTNTSYGNDGSVQFDGSETALYLEELAAKWRCFAPNVPDEQFIQQMMAYSHRRSAERFWLR